MPLSFDELSTIKELLGREPTKAELYMFEAQWSEHCSYKSSKYYLKLLPTKSKDVLIGPGRDAPAIKIFDKYAIVFKIESHNHPSAVDPYNGASTGVGGIVRDILTLGAKPIALLDLLFFGEPNDGYANWLIKGVVKGISDYGNRIGVPVVAGLTWFDKSYSRYPLVNVACVGVIELSKLLTYKPETNDLILIVGNTTGRDGVFGSSFASKPLSDNDSSNIAAVQVGNPLIEKLLIDALSEAVDRGLIKYVKDLGGGGLATAISEVTADYGLGAIIELNSLHIREANMEPEEVLVSESQERMLVIISKEQLHDFASVLRKYDLQYSVIGYLDNTGIIKVYYNGKLVAEVPANELARPQIKLWDVEIPKEYLTLANELRVPKITNLRNAFLELISSPNIVSKEWVYSQYDYEVGIRTVIKPGYGDAAVIRLMEDDKRLGIAVKGDGNPRYTYVDPFRGAANAVGECFRNLVSVGSLPIAIVDELNAGNPEKPSQYWYFTQMVKGISWMAQELRIPIVGGKVSFYNEDLNNESQVKPVTTIVGVGVIEDVRRASTLNLKYVGDYVLIVGVTYPELGSSELLHRCFGIEAGEVPLPRPSTEILNGRYVKKLVDRGYAVTVHDISLGGIAVALTEMCVKGLKGVSIELGNAPEIGCDLQHLLFSESQARYLVEVRRESLDVALEIAHELNVDVGVLGIVDGNELVIKHLGAEVLRFDVNELRNIYEESLEKLLEG
ncbi:MAG: phosphoribosylformylglycinamidine synthase subunit PurL [Sulfolobales archaeon]